MSTDKRDADESIDTPEENTTAENPKIDADETVSTPDSQHAPESKEVSDLASKVADELAEPKKTPIILKILGVLLIIVAVFAVPTLVLVIVAVAMDPNVFGTDLGITSFVIALINIVSLLVSAVLGAIFGINLLRNKRRFARRICEVLIIATIVSLLCELMLAGLTPTILSYLIRLVVLVIIAIYIDPALSDERKLHRKLRDMETREDVEEGTLGRDETGKGFIKLDFFNIFWIFVLACVVGVVIETIYHAITVGGYQDRAGMLYGPFSPIYGFGAVLMTVALNRLYNKSIVLVFLLSAVIGGAFEYLVSWFLEFAFGIVAWDYTGTLLSIDGRTNLQFMIFWGILGCIWIKFLLRYILKLVNLIPWNWRYSITAVCAALMIVNGFLTLAAYDRWYERQAGISTPSNALESFCDENYDDDFMKNRFQTMSIDPSKSTRGNP